MRKTFRTHRKSAKRAVRPGIHPTKARAYSDYNPVCWFVESMSDRDCRIVLAVIVLGTAVMYASFAIYAEVAL